MLIPSLFQLNVTPNSYSEACFQCGLLMKEILGYYHWSSRTGPLWMGLMYLQQKLWELVGSYSYVRTYQDTESVKPRESFTRFQICQHQSLRLLSPQERENIYSKIIQSKVYCSSSIVHSQGHTSLLLAFFRTIFASNLSNEPNLLIS